MKKLLSIMLALILVFSMATVAFADDDEEIPESGGSYYDSSEPASFTIKKAYSSENNVVVNETLHFTVTAATTNPSTATLTVGTNNSVDINALSTDIIVSVPSYSVAGKYEYTISEDAGNTAGVTYTSNTIKVQVLVEYDNDNHKLVIGNPSDPTSGITYYIVKAEDGSKTDTFTNTFKSGSFTVAKDVIGNMANETETFDITVTLSSTKPIGTNCTLAGSTVKPNDWTPVKNDDDEITGYTYSKALTISESSGKQTFSDIPEGVTVTVSENTAANKMNGYTHEGIFTGAYTVVDGEVAVSTEFTSLTVVDSTDSKSTNITVVNSKSTTVDTGITLDSVPYFLMLSIACVGMFLLLSKKRANREY